MKKAFLVNDSTPYHFGPALVTEALERGLQMRGVEIVGRSLYTEKWQNYKSQMDAANLVIVNGEGSIHHNRKTDLLTIGSHYPAVLINYTIQAVDKQHLEPIRHFRLLSARESFSAYETGRLSGILPPVTPDLSLWHHIPRTVQPINEIGIFDAVNKHAGSFIKATGWPDGSFIEHAQQYRRWCTGRFHGITLAMLLNVPFSAYESNTWKNAALMRDAGLSKHYYSSDVEAAIRNIPEEPSKKAQHYVRSARIKIDQLLDKIAALC